MVKRTITKSNRILDFNRHLASHDEYGYIVIMRSFHSKSWQEKIEDPAFDSMIKSYMAFLDDCERLPDGYQSFIHLYEKLDLEDHWWSSENIKESRQENVSQNEITIDEIGQDLLSIFNYTKEDKKEWVFV